jgi:tRNA pseudouridine55 synthase
VQKVKNLIGASKVGHLGTLDPGATGVLPLVIDGATKFASTLAGVDKIYEFTLNLGRVTETDDDEGKVISQSSVPKDSLEKLKATIPSFIGKIKQIPPTVSAVKVAGRRAYKAAREGWQVRLDERPIEIKSLDILSGSGSSFKMRLKCKSGTYVRALCRDIGAAIGCGGHASNIRRLQSGNYVIAMAISLEDLEANPTMLGDKIIAVNIK